MTDNKISAGSYDLNKWLFGGYEKDIITTIYGASGTGKTNLCSIVSVSQAIKGKKVIFVDTEGGFSSERIKQIVASGNDGTKEDYENVLKNILLLKPVNFKEQKEAFEQLLKEIKISPNKGAIFKPSTGEEEKSNQLKEIKKENNIGLIIIDGMTMLYRLELGETTGENNDKEEHVRETNRELARQLRVLAEIARNKNIPIIVTNQVYSTYIKYEDRERGTIPEVRMVGGDLLKYWSKCIIRVENNNGKRKLLLVKHRSLREKELEFTITDSGIKRKGWI